MWISWNDMCTPKDETEYVVSCIVDDNGTELTTIGTAHYVGEHIIWTSHDKRLKGVYSFMELPTRSV